MHFLFARVRSSPALVRVLPFIVFVALTALQPYAGSSGLYWIYFVKTLVVAALLWSLSPLIPEMRWNASWEAALVGIAVFVVWIKLGGLMRAAGLGGFGEWHNTGRSWNPRAHYGAGSGLAILFLTVRLAGSTLLVPCLEEVFYRSFLYRWIRNPDFQSVPIGQFCWVPFLATSLLFGFEHQEWLAGTLCGFAYQGLVCWKNRIGDAITAHAITNGLLGCWVITKGEWHFW
jgi:CAAX prenyl protease-like protein